MSLLPADNRSGATFPKHKNTTRYKHAWIRANTELPYTSQSLRGLLHLWPCIQSKEKKRERESQFFYFLDWCLIGSGIIPRGRRSHQRRTPRPWRARDPRRPGANHPRRRWVSWPLRGRRPERRRRRRRRTRSVWCGRGWLERGSGQPFVAPPRPCASALDPRRRRRERRL